MSRWILVAKCHLRYQHSGSWGAGLLALSWFWTHRAVWLGLGYRNWVRYSNSGLTLWWKYHQTSSVSRTKSQHHLPTICPNHWCRRLVEIEDVVAAAPTGDATTTSEWSTILLSTKVLLILDVSWCRCKTDEDDSVVKHLCLIY